MPAAVASVASVVDNLVMVPGTLATCRQVTVPDTQATCILIALTSVATWGFGMMAMVSIASFAAAAVGIVVGLG